MTAHLQPFPRTGEGRREGRGESGIRREGGREAAVMAHLQPFPRMGEGRREEEREGRKEGRRERRREGEGGREGWG